VIRNANAIRPGRTSYGRGVFVSDTITTSDTEGNRIVNITAMRGESLTDETGESYRWFIEEIARDLRDGLERFVPDSPNGNGPLYKGTQSLLQYDYDNNRNGADIWDNVYSAYGDVYELGADTIYYAAYGCEWFVHMDSGENICLRCASAEHGIYLQSDEYRTAVGLYADTSDDVTCEVFCSECDEQIKEHDDTDLKPCSECENIWAEVYEYEKSETSPSGYYSYQKVTGHHMVHIEVPTFTRRIVSWRLWQGHTIMMMPVCGHETFDIQQEEFHSYANDWYATHSTANYRRYGFAYHEPWTIYCPVCFTEWIKATLTREDQICVECEGPIGWKRAYICKTAEKEPKHDRNYRYDYINGDGGHPGRSEKIEWCVVGDDTGPIYEFDN
jgi:hypothetical protein